MKLEDKESLSSLSNEALYDLLRKVRENRRIKTSEKKARKTSKKSQLAKLLESMPPEQREQLLKEMSEDAGIGTD